MKPKSLALGLILTLTSVAGCAAHAAAGPPAEVSICVEPAWASAGIAPQVRTDGAWIGALASQVVHLRGRPDERRDNLWIYRSSPSPGTLEVLRFSGPRVSSVTLLPGADERPLCGSDPSSLTASNGPGSGDARGSRVPEGRAILAVRGASGL
jgi:hypothetical protein